MRIRVKCFKWKLWIIFQKDERFICMFYNKILWYVCLFVRLNETKIFPSESSKLLGGKNMLRIKWSCYRYLILSHKTPVWKIYFSFELHGDCSISLSVNRVQSNGWFISCFCNVVCSIVLEVGFEPTKFVDDEFTVRCSWPLCYSSFFWGHQKTLAFPLHFRAQHCAWKQRRRARVLAVPPSLRVQKNRSRSVCTSSQPAPSCDDTGFLLLRAYPASLLCRHSLWRMEALVLRLRRVFRFASPEDWHQASSLPSQKKSTSAPSKPLFTCVDIVAKIPTSSISRFDTLV